MIDDRKSFEDPAIIDRYLETLPQADTSYRGRLRRQLAAAPAPGGRWIWSVPWRMAPRGALVLATLCLLAVALVAHNRQQSATGATPDGGTILFSRNNHWYTIAPNGTHLHMLLSSTAGCPDSGCAFFSPNGSRIMVAAQSPNKKRVATAIVNTNGSGYRTLPLPDQTLNLGPGAWSPNGIRIALAGWDDSHQARNGVYAVNAYDGKGLVRLTTSPDGHHDDPLAYSPDGSRLLFYHEGTQGSSSLPGFGGLFETSATGSGRIKLNPPGTQVTDSFGSPGDWSPNGRQVTFTAFSSPASIGQSAVFVEDANGSHRRRITDWGAWSTSAHWSADGNWILFDKVSPFSAIGAHDLFIVHPNGTGLRKIVPAPSTIGQCCAVWSPNGKKILVGRGKYPWTANWNGSRLFRLTRAVGGNAYSWGR